jgi:hypothetical protein
VSEGMRGDPGRWGHAGVAAALRSGLAGGPTPNMVLARGRLAQSSGGGGRCVHSTSSHIRRRRDLRIGERISRRGVTAPRRGGSGRIQGSPGDGSESSQRGARVRDLRPDRLPPPGLPSCFIRNRKRGFRKASPNSAGGSREKDAGSSSPMKTVKATGVSWKSRKRVPARSTAGSYAKKPKKNSNRLS